MVWRGGIQVLLPRRPAKRLAGEAGAGPRRGGEAARGRPQDGRPGGPGKPGACPPKRAENAPFGSKISN